MVCYYLIVLCGDKFILDEPKCIFMDGYDEITFELTNLCYWDCKSCSSDATSNEMDAIFLPYSEIKNALEYVYYEKIILSGGEPLYHPEFGKIMDLCKRRAKDVVVYTNMLTHIVYNAQCIDGIYIECNLNLPENVQKVHILKRVKQGREVNRPEVSLSGNFYNVECNKCDHIVVKPNGKCVLHPCKKNIDQ